MQDLLSVFFYGSHFNNIDPSNPKSMGYLFISLDHLEDFGHKH